MSVRPNLFALVALAGLVLATGLAVVAVGSYRSQGRVYSVAEVHAQLTHNPGGWVGKTVLVRGLAEDCPGWLFPAAAGCWEWSSEGCWKVSSDLASPDTAARTEPLPLVWEHTGPLVTFIRDLPVVGNLMPKPRVPHWGTVETYRVQFRRIDQACNIASRFEAVLLDSAPAEQAVG